MKKVLLICFLFSYLPSHSQSKEFTFGITGGLNYSSIGGDAIGVNPKFGFHAGLFAEKKYSEKFTFNPELIYSLQGMQVQQVTTAKINYSYLNLPLNFRFFPNKFLYLQLGPQLGLVLHAGIPDKSHRSGYLSYINASENVTAQLNAFDLGINGGLGIKVQRFNVSARYCYGLSNTAVSPPSNQNTYFPNRVFQFSCGFLLFK